MRLWIGLKERLIGCDLLDTKNFLDKNNIIAIVGASDNRSKYGNIIYRDLRDAGYKVIPINPNAESVEGDVCYHSLSKVKEGIGVVNTVVPPMVTEKIVRQCRELEIAKVWMQPGSESENAISFCKSNGIDVVYDSCIMMERRYYGL